MTPRRSSKYKIFISCALERGKLFRVFADNDRNDSERNMPRRSQPGTSRRCQRGHSVSLLQCSPCFTRKICDLSDLNEQWLRRNIHVAIHKTIQDKMHKIYIIFSSFAFSAMALLVAGCTATTGNPEVIAEKQSPPDAWENRLEKIMDHKEIVSSQNKEEAENISLEQQYKSEQTRLTDAFADCFAKVFAGRTFDGGVPWKSEGQGYRNIISVNGEGVAMWWTISRRSRSCSPLTTPIQDYQSARIGQEIKFDPSPFNPSFYRIGKWMLENNETVLCWYERRSTLKGVSRHCYQQLPTFIPG